MLPTVSHSSPAAVFVSTPPPREPERLAAAMPARETETLAPPSFPPPSPITALHLYAAAPREAETYARPADMRTGNSTVALPISSSRADALLAAELEALTQTDTRADFAPARNEPTRPATTLDAERARPALIGEVTPQHAAHNPFAPAMAASLYLSAMSFRAQSINGSDLANAANAVQPVGGTRAVTPVFLNRHGPADDTRQRGV